MGSPLAAEASGETPKRCCMNASLDQVSPPPTPTKSRELSGNHRLAYGVTCEPAAPPLTDVVKEIPRRTRYGMPSVRTKCRPAKTPASKPPSIGGNRFTTGSSTSERPKREETIGPNSQLGESIRFMSAIGP